MRKDFLYKKLSTKEIIRDGAKIFHGLRWAHGIVVCPYCGSIHIKDYGDYHYRCLDCKRKFSDRTRTLMHGSKLPVGIWMEALYEVISNNFVSSIELSLRLHINQKSAWLLLSKIRFGLSQDDYVLRGIVSQDEMYIGGSLCNYHYGRKLRLLLENHYLLPNEIRYTKEDIMHLNADIKQPVFGMNDGERIVLYAMPNPIKKEYIRGIARMHVASDSITVSDSSKLYYGWERATGLKIYINNHKKNQYKTKEGYTSNGIENTFSWFKRGFGARITHCKYHQLYLNEFVFRYNTRHIGTRERFGEAVRHMVWRTATYSKIRAYNPFERFDVKVKNGLSTEDINMLLSYGIVESVRQNGKVFVK